ncbi:MAG: winged helix-turn-helix transcriptional regulator [Promethearchaeota archaeon]
MRLPSRKVFKSALACLLVVLALCQPAFLVVGRNVDVSGTHVSDSITGGEGWVTYNFEHNNYYSINSNVNIDLNLWIGSALTFRNLSIDINASDDLSLLINNFEFNLTFNNISFDEGDGEGNQTTYTQFWGSYLFFLFTGSFNTMTISVPIGDEFNTTSDDTWAIFQTFEWRVLNTTARDGHLTTIIPDNFTMCTLSLFRSETSNSTNPDPDPDPPTTNFQLTQSEMVIFSIAGVVLFTIILSTAGIYSKKKYREMILKRTNGEFTTKHRLTIEEVLENDNRSRIIDEILDQPGIHFNELLRRIGLAPGNLVWHLEILCTYKVIGKKRIGQYIVYFPFYQKNPMSNVDIKLAKSKVTLKILRMIEEEPGIYANQIASVLSLNHKTVKYHVDKLVNNNLVEIKKEGRKNFLYPRIEFNGSTDE